MNADKNDKGDFYLYDSGVIIGTAPLSYIDGVPVITPMVEKVKAMQQAASRDGIALKLAAGYRTWSQQYELRKKHGKRSDEAYLTSAPASEFTPMTAKPGFSNHHDGKAYDFNVTGKPKVYAWLVKNAIRFGFIRTVKSERWHWEYRPGKDMFSVVPKTDPSWDNLV